MSANDLARVVALETRESELQRQNLRFDAAVNNMAQGLCMFDAAQRLVVGPWAHAPTSPEGKIGDVVF